MQTFSGLLMHHRKTQGLSQFDLAARADVDRSYINRLESGARAPSRRTAEQLADALGLRGRIVRSEFMLAAGFAVPRREMLDVLLAHEPAIAHALRVLDTAGPATANHLRAAIADAAWLADRARG